MGPEPPIEPDWPLVWLMLVPQKGQKAVPIGISLEQIGQAGIENLPRDSLF